MNAKRPLSGKSQLSKTKSLIVEVTDFGPVLSGKVNLKPLTILIGPNNCGKSYTAMLLKSVIQQTIQPSIYSKDFGPRRRHPYRYFSAPGKSFEIMRKQKDFFKKVQSLDIGESCNVPKQLLKMLAEPILQSILEDNLTQEIDRVFGSKLNELQRINGDYIQLNVEIGSTKVNLAIDNKKLKIKKLPNINYKIRIRVDLIKKHFRDFDVEVKDDEITIVITKHSMIKYQAKGYNLQNQIVLAHINFVLRSLLLSSGFTDCYYLPAARSGIMQAHRTITAAIMKTASLGGIDEFKIPKLSGIVVDFLTQLGSLESERGPLYHVARSFEKELLGGHITFKTVDDYISKIEYLVGRKHFPLHRTSSTISELAPLFLFLKHQIAPRNILIIEEPEAHLHPRNQEIIARLIVRLVRKGVTIIITTHSDLLLRRISDFLLLSRAEDDQRSELSEYNKDDFLNVNEVSVSVFEYVSEASAYRIKPVKVDIENGISQKEFMRIYELLYEKRLKIERELGII